jgi:hypothetical protein
VQDEFGNPVDLEGFTYVDVINYQLTQGLLRAHYEIEYEWTFGDEVLAYEFTSSISQNSSNNWNEPCVATTIFTDCVQHAYTDSRQTNTDENTDYILVSTMTANNLERERGTTYYTNGTMDFEFNNWSGVMTYGADSSVAPTYVATNGMEQISGIYTNPDLISVQALSATKHDLRFLPRPIIFNP